MSIAAPKDINRQSKAASPASFTSYENLRKGSFRSFEDVYHTSYSHGLESIYAIETVDLKTVRRISDQVPLNPTPIKIESILSPPLEPEAQLTFDFGDCYHERMDSFVLNEPITVLQVSQHAEKCLIENGMLSLLELSKADLSSFVYLKGMGQGHIDEIKQKLSGYLKGKVLYRSKSLDFLAWIRSLLSSLPSKKIHVLLEPFLLSELYPLTPAESVEVRRLTETTRQEWRQEAVTALLAKQLSFHHDMRRVSQVYLKPWMERRQGFATTQEIFERIQRVSNDAKSTFSICLFLSSIFFNSEFPFRDTLFQGETDLFFANDTCKYDFDLVCAKAKTYFYNTQQAYSLSELTMLLTKEFARKWQGFPEGFIEKCLRKSTSFRVRKSESGSLSVRLSQFIS